MTVTVAVHGTVCFPGVEVTGGIRIDSVAKVNNRHTVQWPLPSANGGTDNLKRQLDRNFCRGAIRPQAIQMLGIRINVVANTAHKNVIVCGSIYTAPAIERVGAECTDTGQAGRECGGIIMLPVTGGKSVRK